MLYGRRRFLRTLGLGLALSAPVWLSCAGQGEDRPPRPPNFVFVLIDDLGWTDTGRYGSTFHETPHIDRLTDAGMRFTDAYAASPVCSPTRASILTGKHPARLNITDWIGGRQRGALLPAEYVHQLPLDEVTVAETLREAGYATGFIGKWHLGDWPYFPENQGFDVNVAGHGAGHPASYFYPYRAEEGRSPAWDVPGLEDGAAGEYLTDRLTEEALRFIETHRDQPFLLFLAHYAVHTPIQSKPEPEDKYRAKAASLPPPADPPFQSESGRALTRRHQDDPAYAGMVESVDESLGLIMEKLGELGLTQNTVVIFTSDNGGLTTLAGDGKAPTAVQPLRAGKGWLYEGGVRVPLIIRWPGMVAEGGVSAEPVTSADLYPTILQLAGLELRPGQHRDGRSLVPTLRGEVALDRVALYWHFPHYHGSGNRPSGAVRAGDFKLIEWFEDGRVELYDLRHDIGEQVDLSDRMPEKTDELKAMLHAWRREVDARMPRPNPDHR
jgi:arylsulfatase A-like enzyme